MQSKLLIKKSLLDDFTRKVKEKYPLKAFGYFISSEADGEADDFIIFNNDIRNEWKDLFENYGNYYARNEDAGFLATDEETFRINKELVKRKKSIVGVFHSHRRHPAIFSTVDVDLHPSDQLWHLIISLRNVDMPQIKAFKIDNSDVAELKVVEYGE